MVVVDAGQQEDAMLLHLDDKNLEFIYFRGLSICLPTIFLFYYVLKILLQLLIHHPQNTDTSDGLSIDGRPISPGRQLLQQQLFQGLNLPK